MSHSDTKWRKACGAQVVQGLPPPLVILCVRCGSYPFDLMVVQHPVIKVTTAVFVNFMMLIPSFRPTSSGRASDTSLPRVTLIELL